VQLRRERVRAALGGDVVDLVADTFRGAVLPFKGAWGDLNAEQFHVPLQVDETHVRGLLYQLPRAKWSESAAEVEAAAADPAARAACGAWRCRFHRDVQLGSSHALAGSSAVGIPLCFYRTVDRAWAALVLSLAPTRATGVAPDEQPNIARVNQLVREIGFFVDVEKTVLDFDVQRVPASRFRGAPELVPRSEDFAHVFAFRVLGSNIARML